MAKKSSHSLGLREALAEQRRRLKVKLFKGREVELDTITKMSAPLCDYCNEPLWSDCCAMHEWLIKRNALPVEKQHLIMHEYNCVLLHVECHAQHGQTRKCKLRCARAQYARYGRKAILDWVNNLGLRQYVELPLESESRAGEG